MADDKQINAIRYFCAKPYPNDSTKRSKGHEYHDWNYLVQQISYFDFGHIQKDETLVLTVVRLVKKQFPSGPDWNRTVKAKGAHERILSVIRSGLASVGAS